MFSNLKASESPRQRSSPGWIDAWMVGWNRKNTISTAILSSRYMIGDPPNSAVAPPNTETPNTSLLYWYSAATVLLLPDEASVVLHL